MSNEELAARIKDGERDKLLELWEQVRNLIARLSIRRYILTDGLGGVEVDDLIQSGYIAMVNAVEDFDPGAGYKFSTFLTQHLKTAFAEAGGYRSDKQRMDPLQHCDSLDRPIDEGSEDTLLDLQAAPGDCIADADRRIWLEQLHAALARAMEPFPEDWRSTLECHYYRGKTQEETAQELHTTRQEVRKAESKALIKLSGNKELRRYREELELDRRTPWYLHVGRNEFTTTGTSAVEKIVNIREQERRRFAL